MRIAIIAVGKIRERELRVLLDDYYGRIRRYARVEEHELREEGGAALAQRLDRLLRPDTYRIALEVEGKALSSPQLAQWLEARAQSTPDLAFLIGGAYGLPPEVSQQANFRWSLSALTLPHRLARLFVAEQVYRAFTILRNEPYSH
mgnify:CR=1 FL=1